MNFWIKLTQKRYFWTKKKENYHRILHIQINLDSKFQSQQTILIFGTNFQKKVYFRSKTQKNEHRYWILHIQISLSTNFQSKINQIDTSIEFCIFELVFVSNITLNMVLNILKVSLKSRYFEHFERKIGYVLPPRFFLA